LHVIEELPDVSVPLILALASLVQDVEAQPLHVPRLLNQIFDCVLGPAHLRFQLFIVVMHHSVSYLTHLHVARLINLLKDFFVRGHEKSDGVLPNFAELKGCVPQISHKNNFLG